MKLTRLLTNTIGTAMLAGALMLAPQAAQARVFLSVGFAPPAIPVYEQPLCPGDGYIWTPGYWQYTDQGYEWVDGAWVLAPYTGALWTPGYWGYGDSGYLWNAGYWGPTIGYYGGINYGFGYFGTGFYGGYWNGGHFFYNREYNHFGDRGGFRNVYDQRVNGFDGRPGGASFARTNGFENRGGTLNSGMNHGVVNGGNFGQTNRNGFGQNANQNFGRVPQMKEPNRIADGSNMRGVFDGSNIAANNSAANRGGDQQLAYNQARPANNFTGGFSGNSNARATTSANNYRPAQGASFGGNSNARQTAPVNNFHPSQGANTGGGQRSQPAPSFHASNGGGGSFHGNSGGGGSHGGRR